MARRDGDRIEMDQAVGQIEGYWRRVGIPARQRATWSAELRDDLRRALAEGRAVNDVIGRDRIGFAAVWVAAAWKRPWLDPLLLAPMLFGILFGLQAFMGAWLHGLPAPGMPVTPAIITGLIGVVATGWYLLRWSRAYLTVQQTTAVGLLIVTGYLVGAVALQGLVEEEDNLMLGGPLASVLLVGGIACGGLLSFLKRTGRL